MKFNLLAPAWALSLMVAITNAGAIAQPPRLADDDREKVYQKYWAGLSINSTSDSPLSAISGVIHVPKFFPPSKGDKANISFVIHWGTSGMCGAAASAGIDMKIRNDGKADLAAWTHASHDDGLDIASVHWLDEMRGKRFDIIPGDEVTVTIKAIDRRSVWIFWKNARTGDHEQLLLGDYNVDLCTSWAAWVTERRPGEMADSSGDWSRIPDFGTSVLKDMQWGTEDAKVWNAGERKGPAKEKWHIVGKNDGWGEYVNLRCNFFNDSPDITPEGMECTQITH
ncbi:concanavalin A-like lectin/glucanase domain-containing protein [Cercophora samala]|uniref:Concanavalin A-like lectin/glucanase domain-containing protein n=1 Tax=Cercophora samala TaxID=330535 RepID=A0AA40DEA5_9PEZI|nr:concanavalin A-like lectin/glucanase domain-containing protein [Cercophora samala]